MGVQLDKNAIKVAPLFWAKVRRHGKDGCWEWLASSDKDGYGVFAINRKQIAAHRYSYLIHKGDIPTGMQVLHKCDNPTCSNPQHLFLGTGADNMADKVAKGRQSRLRGEEHPMARLSRLQVQAIRQLVAKGKTEMAVAKMFGVSFQHVSDIVLKKKWAWL